MSGARDRWRVVSLSVLVAAFSACQMIAGIDDHAYQPAVTTPTAQCVQYCDSVERGCPVPNSIYSTRETCLGVCSRLPPGDPLEPADNTVACRSDQAKSAIGTMEPKSYCPAAGPGGAGRCGTNCASYCALLQRTCPEQFAELSRCEAQCTGLLDTGGFDVKANYGGDTLQCRLVHVSAAAVDPAIHCPHAQLHPTDPCSESAAAAPDCPDFCRLGRVACTGDAAIYESDAQCLAVCGALAAGTNADRDQNTVGCRKWHLYNALIDPATHCPHAGPGGDGHCGHDEPDDTGNCDSYCRLAARGCSDEFDAKYSSQAACQRECSARPAEFGARADSPTKYRVGSVDLTSTLQCRLLHAARALTNAAECANVFGGGACP